jgi:hypothetical protein
VHNYSTEAAVAAVVVATAEAAVALTLVAAEVVAVAYYAAEEAVRTFLPRGRHRTDR